jgi:predicted glycoside hydrolase/deacetylase ChbG (UPF0249 family)
LVVIVNADDLGMNQRVNREIFRLMEAGVVTSATMLANGDAVEEAALAAQRFPHCSFGVHLNLTEFQALTRSGGLGPILDETGRFKGNHIREIGIGAAIKGAIFGEWCAQIDRLLALGIKPSHIDSHHHTHTIPALLPVLRSVRKKYAIERIRISRNVYVPTDPVVLRMKKAGYNTALRWFAGFKTTQFFSGLDMFLASGGGAGVSSIELMVHPGSTDSETESDALIQWVRNCKPDVKLISYKEL